MRTLILPCETRVREFDAKLLLGLIAAAGGVPAIVGAKKEIDLNLAGYPDGVYVGKSVTARSRHNLALARSCGHRVALWDEEGLVWASREVYWRTKVDGPTLNEAELLIAWGEDNAAAWREHPDYAGAPIAVSGNPRADLLNPALTPLFDEEVKAISAEYGRFILINTNFSRVNHVQPRQNRHLKWLREQRPDDPRGGFAAHKFELFRAFVSAIPELARRLPEVSFVIRPHPSEQRRVWDELAAPLANVQVAQQGNVVAWLLASDGLIHNGCTTAVEAFQLGRPALAYRPVISADYDHPLPNGISLSCEDLEQLCQASHRCRQDRDAVFADQAEAGGRAVMARALAGIDDKHLASERILKALQPLLGNAAPPPGSRPRVAASMLALRRAFRVVESRLPGTANYRPYLEHMFPLTSLGEVRQRCQRLIGCIGGAGISAKGIAITSPGRNVFALTPSSRSGSVGTMSSNAVSGVSNPYSDKPSQ
jgi:surface carbohydrate biosynthesis protein